VSALILNWCVCVCVCVCLGGGSLLLSELLHLLIANITKYFSLLNVIHICLGCCILKLAKVKVSLAPRDYYGSGGIALLIFKLGFRCR